MVAVARVGPTEVRDQAGAPISISRVEPVRRSRKSRSDAGERDVGIQNANSPARDRHASVQKANFPGLSDLFPRKITIPTLGMRKLDSKLLKPSVGEGASGLEIAIPSLRIYIVTAINLIPTREISFLAVDIPIPRLGIECFAPEGSSRPGE